MSRDLEASDPSVFLPWSLWRLAAKRTGGAWRRTVRGSLMFCDVAGFTPLTEALAAIGREGAEELTRVLNAHFTRMIAIVEAHGGDVLRFGGDAMTVLFPGRSHGKALAAASRMMEALRRHGRVETRAGAHAISMKIGLAFGECHLGFVGDAALGYDYYAAGAPLDEAADAEHRARPEEVVCHRSFHQMMGEEAEMTCDTEGFGRVVAFRADEPAVASFPRPPSAGALVALIPPYLAERAGPAVLGEHRGTAVVFIAFPRPPAAPGLLHTAVERRFRLFAASARRYGGIVNKLDFGDKGAKAILLFGAPHALEDKEEMATRAAKEIVAACGSEARAGITSSPLFSGPVGSPGRRELTVMGDGINLAARLMQAAAPGQILCGPGFDSAAPRIALVALPAIRVKGKSEPIPVFVPEGERAAAESEEALVEREAVQSALLRYVETGEGGPLVLIGEAGMGKSAVIERLRRKVAGMPVAAAVLHGYSRDSAYAAWRPAVLSVMGIASAGSLDDLRSARDRALAREQAGHRCLLNPLLRLPEETTPALKNLSASERKTLTFAIVGRLLHEAGPRLVLIDNLHCADPMSLELLSFLCEEGAAHLRIVATARPFDGCPARLQPLALPPLRPGGVETMLRRTFGLSDVPREVLAWFCERGRGNPAAVRALFSAVEAASLVTRDQLGGRIDGDRLHRTTFPETLEGLYLAQVDRLAPRERDVVQAASILGASVSMTLLARVADLGRGDLDAAVQLCVDGKLLAHDTWGERPYVRFADALLRDAVYEAVPFARKREGHRKAALALESEDAETPRVWPALAHHFEMADEPARARHYARRAGRRAAAAYDNVTALRWLEQVCRSVTADPEDVEDAFHLLDVYGALGRKEDAHALLERLAHMEQSLSVAYRSRLCNYVSRDLALAQRLDEAESLLLRGLRMAEEGGDLGAIAMASVNLAGRIYGPTGRLDEARACLERVLALPEGPGVLPSRVTALMNLGVLLREEGKLDEAGTLFEQAYRSAERARMGPLLARLAENRCAISCELGRFEDGVRWGRRAVRTYETFSMRSHLLAGRVNLARAHLCLGELRQARAHIRDVLGKASLHGQAVALAYAHDTAMTACGLDGRLTKFLEHAAEALAQFRRLDDRRMYGGCVAGIGGLFYALGLPERAAAFLDEHGDWAFVAEAERDPAWMAPLGRLLPWMRGQDVPLDALDPVGAAGPLERLERILWSMEAGLEAESPSLAAQRVSELRAAFETVPLFEGRARALRLLVRHGVEGSVREARDLVARSLGGPWGFRLLVALWGREREGGEKRRLARLSNRRLAFLHRHCPSWAWQAVLAWPETSSLLGATATSRGSSRSSRP